MSNSGRVLATVKVCVYVCMSDAILKLHILCIWKLFRNILLLY